MMWSLSNVSLSTGSFQNLRCIGNCECSQEQMVLSDKSETCQRCLNKRIIRKESPVLEKTQDHAARRQMINCTCQGNIPKAKLRAQQAAF